MYFIYIYILNLLYYVLKYQGNNKLIYTKPRDSQSKINRVNLCLALLVVTLVFSFLFYLLIPVLKNRRGKKAGGKLSRS